MRTLLRHTITGLYFQGPDKWTENPDRAVDFRFVERAIKYSETWNLKDVELAFAFDEPRQVTAMPFNKVQLWQAAV